MASSRSLILGLFTTVSMAIGVSAPEYVAAGDFRQAVLPKPPPTLASLVDNQITAVERLVIDAAEAMPEAQFGFSPESLRLPGADYKGVRTFTAEVKHVAASNYALWASPHSRDLHFGMCVGCARSFISAPSSLAS
jgi:hypothetical protein